MTNKDKKTITNHMKQGTPFILINSQEKSPTYRVLTQTLKELPAPDLGLDNIQYSEHAIQKGIKNLIGTFVYDETRSTHNKLSVPEMRGRKVAKVVNAGYCPEYGAYTDWEVFDNDFVETMKQAIDNKERGLPVYEGPSTELNAKKAERYGINNARVTDFDYNGLVWIDKPRDTSLGVCNVITNSIIESLEDNNMAEDIKEFKLSKDEYDALKAKEAELEELKPKFENGLQLYNEGKNKYEALKTEKEDLFNQLVPVWTQQGEQKMAMVNSILETIPEADRATKKADLEKLDITGLGVIVNSLPTGCSPTTTPTSRTSAT